MANLIYSAITSLDGYIADESGGFEWSAPDPEVHAFINKLERPVGTHIYGRRMYETMRYWQTVDASEESSPGGEFAAIWRAAEKIVVSKSLAATDTDRTRLERSFDPATIRALKASAAKDISVGGANVAGQALATGLVDELHLFVVPVIVGGGTPAIRPKLKLRLQLVTTKQFEAGTVHLHYRVLP